MVWSRRRAWDLGSVCVEVRGRRGRRGRLVWMEGERTCWVRVYTVSLKRGGWMVYV